MALEDNSMIKHGMWFENEEHYNYYLDCMKNSEAVKALGRLQEVIFRPLIRRAKELLKQQ